MILEIPQDEISSLLIRQIDNLFSISRDDEELIRNVMSIVLKKTEDNFSYSENKYYNKGGITYFNPFHSGQYCIFLYYMSRQIAHPNNPIDRNTILADKIYYLNKVMNSVDMFYEIELPAHFGVEHPIGSVMGRAKFGDNFFFYQGCTVGGNHDDYPIVGNNVVMCANSKILGRATIGNNVTLGAGALVKDQNVPSNVNVFGQSPDLIIKSKKS